MQKKKETKCLELNLIHSTIKMLRAKIIKKIFLFVLICWMNESYKYISLTKYFIFNYGEFKKKHIITFLKHINKSMNREEKEIKIKVK